MTSDERVQIFVPSPQGTPYNTITKTSTTTTSIGAAANFSQLFVPYRMPQSESYRSLTPLNMSSQSPAHENVKENTKVSLVSSSSAEDSNEKTIANDVDSLPLDQPVSISQIQLEHVSQTD